MVNLQEHIQLEPVQRGHEVDIGDRGIRVQQLHARHHLLPGAAPEDGGGEAEEHLRHGQARRRRALRRRSLRPRLLRRAGAEPRESPPCLRCRPRIEHQQSSQQQDHVGERNVLHGPRQRHVGPLDRPAGTTNVSPIPSLLEYDHNSDIYIASEIWGMIIFEHHLIFS